jgi:hypothetical protein
MRTAPRVALPVLLPRAITLWALTRLGIALLPIAIAQPFGLVEPNPLALIMLCGIVGLLDIRVRGERMLWANLGMHDRWLFALGLLTAATAESVLALLRA